jgi:hypothetical protein
LLQQKAATEATTSLFKSGQTPQSIVAGVAAGNQKDFEYLNSILTAMGDDSQTRTRILEALHKHTLSQKAETDRIVRWLEQVEIIANRTWNNFNTWGQA